MEIIRLKDTVNPVLPASVATIGFFDGVHRGHQFLIRQVRQEAQASGLSSMVITFDQHPRQVLLRLISHISLPRLTKSCDGCR